MDWFNYIGLIIMIIMMIPNIIFSIKVKDGYRNIYVNKLIETLEQVSRFSCFGLMIFNIPYIYFNFWFDTGLLIYIITNSIFIIVYILSWIICWNKYNKCRSYLLSIVPSIIFVFSGIMLLNIPLIVMSLMFAFCHITITLKNAYGISK